MSEKNELDISNFNQSSEIKEDSSQPIEELSERIEDTTDTEIINSDFDVNPPIPSAIEDNENITDEGEVSDSDDEPVSKTEQEYVQMKSDDINDIYRKPNISINRAERSGIIFSQSREHVFVPMSTNPDGMPDISVPPPIPPNRLIVNDGDNVENANEFIDVALAKFDRILRELSDNIASEHRASESVFRNYRELMHNIWFRVEQYDTSDDHGVINQQGVIFDRLKIFHDQINSTFNEMMKTFENQIRRLEISSQKNGNKPDYIDWIRRLRAHMQHLRFLFDNICIPQRFLFPPSQELMSTTEDKNCVIEPPEYVYLKDLPQPKLPTSYFVSPVVPVNMSFTVPQVRSDISVVSDSTAFKKKDVVKEASPPTTPNIQNQGNCIPVVSTSFSTVVTSSDSTFTINSTIPSINNPITHTTSASNSQVSVISTASQGSAPPIFGQSNPFGPNRNESSLSTNFSLPIFNRPPPPIGNNSPVSVSGRANPPLNVPPPTSIQPSALPQATRIPSLLDIQVAPPTSIFKRATQSDPAVAKRSKMSPEGEDISEDEESDEKP